MTSNLSTKLAIATAGVCLSFAAFAVNSAQAATITYEFTTTTFSENFLKGKFSYDEAAATPVDNQTGVTRVDEEDIFDFSFTYLGESFTKEDVNFNYPDLLLIDGSPSEQIELTQGGLYFSYIGRMSESFVIKGGEANNAFEGDDFAAYVTYTKVESPTTSVPEPSVIAGLAVFGLAGLMKKKLASSQDA